MTLVLKLLKFSFSAVGSVDDRLPTKQKPANAKCYVFDAIANIVVNHFEMPICAVPNFTRRLVQVKRVHQACPLRFPSGR